MLQSPSAPVRPSLVMPVLAAIVAVAIFVVDTVTPLDIAIAVLYVAVVLLAMDFAGRNGILIVAGGCAALTVLSYAITHWNRAATELYGWRPEQAIGRKAAELLHTEFPAPFDYIMSELNRTGRWEGELVHTARDGRRLVVASRWALQRDGRGRPGAILE